jgi:hypothetical protein
VPLSLNFGAGVVLGGTISVCYGGRALLLSNRSRKWPFVMGRIVESGVATISERSDGSHYRVVARYTYQVNGTTYEGRTVCFGGTDVSLKLEAEVLAQKAPEGEAKVYYNPGRPQQSALIPSTTEFGRYWLYWGLFFIFFGLLMSADIIHVTE